MSEGEDDGYLACIEDIKKCKLDIVEGEKANSVWLISAPSQPPKKRGRPNRKNFYEDDSIVLIPPPATPLQKKRGRPRKNV